MLQVLHPTIVRGWAEELHRPCVGPWRWSSRSHVHTHGHSSSFILFLLQETMYLEPVGTSPVARSSLGHAHSDTFLQPARFAGRTVLLVDYTSSAILTRGDGADVVV